MHGGARLEGPVIGLSLDGTGYGTDGRIWGGEVLIARLDRFERFAHLDYVPMPGGDAAVREPWRMAFAHLLAAGFDVTSDGDAGLLGHEQKEARLLTRMIERGINAPLTSSLGRLFDAVAAVVLNRRAVDYEAQAAIELEGIAVDEPDDIDGYEIAFQARDTGQNASRCVLQIAPMWKELLRDLKSRRRQAADRRAVSRWRCAVRLCRCCRMRRDRDRYQHRCYERRRACTTAAWRGCCAQGSKPQGFEVFQHRRVSPGDGGLSYGQAAAAAAILTNR